MIFISYKEERNRLVYRQNLDGTDLICLTTKPGRHEKPVWSPDGEKIAYLYAESLLGKFQLYVMNKEGKNVKKLTDLPQDVWSISWSKDGEKLLYSSKENEKSDIFLINSKGGERNKITHHEGDNVYPSWSHDNKYIAYESSIDKDIDGNIYIMDFPGNNSKKLTDSPSCKDMKPLWSPDDRKIIFTRKIETGKKQIFIINPDGTGIKNITGNSGSNWSPRWSPDGKKIVFQSTRDGNIEIYVMNGDGTNVARITSEADSSDWYPIWHPNGKWIIFNSDRGNNPLGSSIYMIDLKGKNLVNLSSLPWRKTYPCLFEENVN